MTGWDGTGIDPWLPHRLAAETAISTAERDMYRAWWGSFSDWLVQVQRSVMAGEQPDPNGVWSEEPDWQTRMADFVQGPVKDTIGKAYAALFGPGYRFDARPAVTTHLAQVHNRMVRTPEQVYDTIAATIARGAGNGDSIPTIAARVSDVLTATGTPEWRNRATTVARSETLGALNAGRADAHVAVAEVLDDTELEQQWISTLDSRCRPSHVEADLQRVPVGQPFTVGGHLLMHPGDPFAPPEESVNCRCSTLLVEEGEEVDMTGRGFTDEDEWWAEQDAAVAAKVEEAAPTVVPLKGAEAAAAVPARISTGVQSGAPDGQVEWRPGTDPGWPEGQAEAARFALRTYSGNAFEDVNDYLRGIDPPGDLSRLDRTIANLDDVMKASPLTAPTETWRGIAEGQLFGDRLDGNLTGFEWTEKAFSSTSTDRATAELFTGNHGTGFVIRVVTPDGVGAVHLTEEDEVLLERGLGMRVVADHGWQGTGVVRVRRIDVEVIPR